MLCEEIMNRNVKSLREQDSALTAAKLMRDANVGFLPICTAAGTVVGTITDRDIVVRLGADGKPLTTSVGSLMTHDVVACRPKDDLRHAEQLMQDHKKSRVLCTDDQGRPVGVISLSDIAQHEDGHLLGKLIRTISSREARKS